MLCVNLCVLCGKKLKTIYMKKIILFTVTATAVLMLFLGCTQQTTKMQTSVNETKTGVEATKLRDKFFQTALDACPAILEKFQDDGSIIHADIGYTIYQQYIGFYFAFLHCYEHPDNPWYNDATMLERAIRAWDHFATRVNEQGETHIITMNQDWGYGLEEWGFYYWLSTYDLIKDKLPDGGARWLEYIQRIYRKLHDNLRKQTSSEAFATQLARHQVHNHFVWTVLGMYRYGQLMNDDEAKRFSTELMHRVFDAQLPIGTWLENEGLVINYADITNCPISIYAIYSGDERAAKAIERCFSYVNALKNPDFSKVLGVDERNRFTRSLAAQTAPSFAFSEGGVEFLSRWIQNIAATGQLVNDTHGLVAVCEMLRLLPDVDYISDFTVPAPLSTSFPEQYLYVREVGQWILSFCGMKHKAYDNRWNLERQGLLGIYVNGSGPLMGGAHSISQPEFSLFNVIADGKLHYMHDTCIISDDNITLKYGGRTCLIEVLNLDERQIELRFSVNGLQDVDRAFVNLPLYYLKGSNINVGDTKLSFDEDYVSQWIEADINLRLRGIDFTTNVGSTLRYPVFPYNSYKQKQERNFDDVYGIWSIELDYMQSSVEVTLTNRDL